MLKRILPLLLITAFCASYAMDYHKHANGEADNNNSEISSGINEHYESNETDGMLIFTSWQSASPEIVKAFRLITKEESEEKQSQPILADIPLVSWFGADYSASRRHRITSPTTASSTSNNSATVKIPDLRGYKEVIKMRHQQLHEKPALDTTALLSVMEFFEVFSQKELSIKALPKTIDTFFDSFWNSHGNLEREDLKELYYAEIKEHKRDLYQALFSDEALAQIPEYVALSEHETSDEKQ